MSLDQKTRNKKTMVKVSSFSVVYIFSDIYKFWDKTQSSYYTSETQFKKLIDPDNKKEEAIIEKSS